MGLKKHAANLITSIRLVGAIALIFIKPLTTAFYIVYTFCGLSDAVDGLVARKLKITSKFGSKLDSACDLLFYTVMMVKIIPKLCEMLWIPVWIFLFAVLLLRVAAYIYSAAKFRKFASVHTIFNKITGAGVFAVPYFILLDKISFNVYGSIVCTVALIAATVDLVSFIKNADLADDVKE